MSFNLSKKLCICLLNVSEARNKEIVERIAKAAVSSCHNQSTRAAVLNIFSDYDYNRSVITIAASVNGIAECVVAACKQAYGCIDLTAHAGGHPRLGAVDLIPIHPVSDDTSLQHCGKVAQEIAQRLSSEVPGTSFFLFGHADEKGHRGLVQRRKEVKWYESNFAENSHDVGEYPTSRYGLTGVGAIPYVMNCNVTIETNDLNLGRDIAKNLRATSVDGLPGVQTMAFHHEGTVEIACNVESVDLSGDSIEQSEFLSKYTESGVKLLQSFGNFYNVSPTTIYERVKDYAAQFDVKTQKECIVGFTPGEANKLAAYALSTEQYEFWKTRTQKSM